MNKAKIIKLIEVTCSKGSGTKKDPKRFIKQYWTFKGKKLFEKDDYFDDVISRKNECELEYEVKKRGTSSI